MRIPALALVATPCLFPALAGAISLPFGFVDEPVATGLDTPTTVAVDGLGRLWVAEKGGRVWIYTGGVRAPEPFIDLTDEVHNAVDRGLLGLALHPDHLTNGEVYLLYGVDPIPGQPDEPGSAVSFGRLVRYVSDGERAIPGSREVLIGAQPGEGFPECFKTHGVGSLRFGQDGSLLVSAGEGAHADFVDFGQNVSSDDPDCEAMFGAAQDLGAARAQSLDTLGGKILRIDPATGRGLPDNPFHDGDPDSFRSRVWALGLRNPFRFAMAPDGGAGPGTAYVCDVGWRFWEELNVVAPGGGSNFGWPCREGTEVLGAYSSSPLKGGFCDGTWEGVLTDPVVSWHHVETAPFGFSGSAATGAVWSDAPGFPFEWRGGVFFCDMVGGWIRFARIQPDGSLSSLEAFAFGVPLPVDLAVDPATGGLLYVAIGEGSVRRIRWVVGNSPPQAVAHGAPAAGSAPLTVQFSSNGTYDPDGDPLTLFWDFGDGSPVVQAPNPTHLYPGLGTWDAVLLVADGKGPVAADTVRVETRNQPPTVTLESPTHGRVFEVDEWIDFAATASDVEDGSALDWRWEVQLIHNAHVHPAWFVWDGPFPPPFLAEGHGDVAEDRISYRVRVTVTDSGGLSTTEEAVLVSGEIVANAPPAASFEALPALGNAPLAVSFDGLGSSDPDGDLLFPDWDFGDGLGAKGGLQATHIFGAPGEYDVTLSVEDVILERSAATRRIAVFPSDGLEVHWPFDGTGPTALDASGHGRDAGLTGADRAPGVLGSALALDGSGAATFPGSLLSGADGFTIAAWIRPDALVGGLCGQPGVVALGFAAPGTLAVVTGQGGSVLAPFPYRAEQWHHVAAVGDGDGLSLWLNGELLASGGFGTWSYGESGSPLVVGGAGLLGTAYEGRIDEVRIHDRAVGAAGLRALGRNPAVNRPPTVVVGSDFDAAVGVPMPLSGDVTDDGLPGAALTLHWEVREGPAVPRFSDPGAPSPDVTFPRAGTYRLALVAGDGEYVHDATVLAHVVDFGEAFGVGGLAGAEGIASVRPNPARGPVTIDFGIREGRGQPFRMGVYDVRGRLVADFPRRRLAEGSWQVFWDRRDRTGRPAAPGVYFVSMRVGEARYTRRLVVLD